MSNTIRFEVHQNKITKKISLQIFRNNGDNIDDWVSFEKIEDMTIEEFKQLKIYLDNLFSKNNKQ